MPEHTPQIIAYGVVLLIYVFGMWPCRKTMARDSSLLGFVASIVLVGIGLLIAWCGFFILNHLAAAEEGVMDKSLTDFRYVPTWAYVAGGIVVLLILVSGGKRKRQVKYTSAAFVNAGGSISHVGTKTVDNKTIAYRGWNCRHCGFENENAYRRCVNCEARRPLRTI